MFQLPDTLKLEKVNTDDFQTPVSYDRLGLYAVQAGIFKGYKWFIWFMDKKASQCYVDGKLQKSYNSFHIHIEYKVKKMSYMEYTEYLAQYVDENHLEMPSLIQLEHPFNWLDGTEFYYLEDCLFDITFEEARNTIFNYINIFKGLADQNIII